ncbi:LLM class flavin-dependent oxidoreductase [Thermomonospora umbrina]|uniref:Alkanesulfonate monooxygenase SsuD/methylene tetrahydromethanopterin reductase-like flavin-dependent oxidoreductase (Luciferase family) n=1 Tax=Thermomonospora umbrina TaxID=111806 RepID=A0A3D9SMI7_9ACTN|nr:LLM class flavin-dependent oxidoreductase [Thermomonospora umbrina]REE97146.1 alkanesulfonate monooxygenase SsuD/methylene tetrahydromethanopterin reductase-like flavin-dependent oxidoreductase (luciferase family) [Thermomonospora umbrina]
MTPRFGIQVAPVADDLPGVRRLARLADDEGLDLLGVQDHPYAAAHADAFSVMGVLLAETRRLRVFPDVASLPLRGPAMLGKAASALDLLSDGRFELGIGSGGFWQAITAMGVPAKRPAEALAALEEGIEIIRAMWRPGESVKVHGDHYTVNGVHAGPAPAHRVGIWVGSVGPRANALTGRLADGWAAPIPHYLPYEKWREAQDTISRAAVEAGRDPGAVLRMAQLVGEVTTGPATAPRLQGEEPIRTTADEWAKVIAGLATETGFDTFVYWPETTDETQLLRWSREVVPAARALLA